MVKLVGKRAPILLHRHAVQLVVAVDPRGVARQRVGRILAVDLSLRLGRFLAAGELLLSQHLKHRPAFSRAAPSLIRPKSHRLFTALGLAVEQRHEACAVEHRLVIWQGDAGQLEQRRVDVRRVGVHGRDAVRLDSRRPLDDRRHPDAALVQAAFARTQTAGRAFGDRAVVAAIPKHRVVGDAEFADAVSQFAQRGVHRRDLAVKMRRAVRLVGVHFFVFVHSDMRAVGVAKPDHREERLVALGRLGDPVQREVGGDVRAFAVGLDHASVVAEERAVLVKIRAGKPVVESAVAGAGRAVGAHRADVPLAEMRRRVAGFLERLGDGDLLRPQGVAPCKTAEAIRVAPGHHAAASRRADGRRRVKPVEPQTGPRHLVHHRRLEHGMTVVPCVPPALVISHAENEVRTLIGQRLGPGS